MNSLNNNNLNFFNKDDWIWCPFLSMAKSKISQIGAYELSVPLDFLNKDALIGTESRPIRVKTLTWACRTQKLCKVRAACVYADKIASVLNLLAIPNSSFDLPFLGVDLVTLPTGHLLALDLQPVLKNDRFHTEKVWNSLALIHSKWKDYFPDGGAIPEEAKQYFSPGFLWTKLPICSNSEKLIRTTLMHAYEEYLDFYLELVCSAEEVSQERSISLRQGQERYMRYRIEKDPARKMLTAFYGNNWTESYIRDFLFDI